MGRSVPTYRMTIEQVIVQWSDFKRALRYEDKEIFNKIMDKARTHSSAASYQVSSDPVETMFLAILIEQEKEIEKLKKLSKK